MDMENLEDLLEKLGKLKLGGKVRKNSGKFAFFFGKIREKSEKFFKLKLTVV